MNEIAVTHVNVKALIVSLVGAAILLFALVGTAGAASPVGKDGKIHACYRVKGKPKGGLRIVPAKQKRCKRGERKVAWSASSMTGVPGAGGAAGTTTGGQSGSNGANGANGTDGSTEAVLKTQIANLTLKVESLEGILDGLLPQVQGTLATLGNLKNADLLGAVKVTEDLLSDDPTEALNNLPLVKTLCDGTKSATEGVNELEVGVKGLTVLGLPSLSLGLGSLTGPIDSFSCVTP